MTLGALWAQGQDPDRVMDWSWDKIMRVARGIKMYHLDLFSTLWSGKSPIMEEAQKEVLQREAAQQFMEDVRQTMPEAMHVDEATARALGKERADLLKVEQMGFPVKVTKPEDRIDGFAIFRERRAAFLAKKGDSTE